ncbi:hypothetical protein F4824DRAFT_494053 [Ustulina deusta]|nr:hypothetical protein F4824DRAFT_494053 [Ustulina deusta]
MSLVPAQSSPDVPSGPSVLKRALAAMIGSGSCYCCGGIGGKRLQSELDELQAEQEELSWRLHDVDQPEAIITSSGAITLTEPTHVEDPIPQQLILELNRVEWKAFTPMRRSHIKESLFTIDVLKVEPVVSFERPDNTIWGMTNPRRPAESKVSTNKPAATSNSPMLGQTPLAERILVNSKHILKILEKIRGEQWMTRESVVMIRPYTTLAYHDEDSEHKLASRWGRVKSSKGEGSGVNADDNQDEHTSSPTAYQHLKCLIDFIDDGIHRKLQYLEGDRCQTVTFSDIWYVYRRGIEVIERTRRQLFCILSISSVPHVVWSPYRRWRKADEVKSTEEAFSQAPEQGWQPTLGTLTGDRQRLILTKMIHQREPSITIYPRPLEDIKRQNNSLSDDDFLIMTYRVFGFVLRSRKWGGNEATPTVDEESQIIFGQLVLPKGQAHQRSRKPWSLETHFSLANKWGCILLLDEADVFLAKLTPPLANHPIATQPPK